MIKRVVFTILTCMLLVGGVLAQDDTSKVETPVAPTGVVFKPTIGVGTGMFTFYGDITKGPKTNLPVVSRVGYDLRVTQPLTDFLDMNFYVLFGKLSANERSLTRNLNFESTVSMGGVALSYNFNHALPEERLIDPYIMVGIESFEFLSKTDLYDQHGNKYHYWQDGSIRNMDESDPNSDQAIRLTRDYTYESDIRELNLDEFGKYAERSWAVPVGLGANLHVSERVKFRIGTAMHFTFTDFIDGVTDESLGDRVGDAANDKFLFTSFNINYQIGINPTSELEDGFDDYDFQGIDTDDEDLDLVRDFEDDCSGTPSEAIVDEKGCPEDGDKDGVPDYLDDELDSPDSAFVDVHGVAITDEMIQAWHDKFSDSTGAFMNMNVIERPVARSDDDGKSHGIVGKKRYQLIVQSDGTQTELTEKEALDLMRMPGITVTTDENGHTIITAGSSDDLNEITRRKLDLESQGIDTDIVETKPDGTQTTIPDNELPNTGSSEVGVIDPASQSSDLVFRIQLGAYSRQLSPKIFEGLPQLFSYTSSDDGLTRYYTGAFVTYKEAAQHRIDMIEEGFEDAFIVSLKGGEKVSLSSTGQATPINNQVDIDDQVSGSASGSSASGVKFRVQVAAYIDEIPAKTLSRLLSIGNVDRRKDDDGKTKFVVGEFDTYEEAKKYASELAGVGNDGAFVVGEFNGKLISSEEALELQK
ncbi:MAG: SPOR domain-containing protein [Flavobacteriales bacterium]|nr:SPOR domain-containing protein [Flavobacteriales bacterium]